MWCYCPFLKQKDLTNFYPFSTLLLYESPQLSFVMACLKANSLIHIFNAIFTTLVSYIPILSQSPLFFLLKYILRWLSFVRSFVYINSSFYVWIYLHLALTHEWKFIWVQNSRWTIGCPQQFCVFWHLILLVKRLLTCHGDMSNWCLFPGTSEAFSVFL